MRKRFNAMLIGIYKKYHISFQHILYVLLIVIFIEVSFVYSTMNRYTNKDYDYTAYNTVISLLRSLQLSALNLEQHETSIFKVSNKVDPELQKNQINIIKGKLPGSFIVSEDKKVHVNIITYAFLRELIDHLKEHHSLFIAEQNDQGEWTTAYTFYHQQSSVGSVIIIVIIMHAFTATMLLLLIYIFRYVFPAELLKTAARLIKSNKNHQDLILPEEMQEQIDRLRQKIQSLIHEKTIMLSSMSHDMKNTLTNLHLLVSMIDDQEISEQMYHQLDEIQMIIDSSLAFSEGSNTKNKKTFNLTELLINVECELEDKGYEFNFDIALPDECFIAGYPALLKRALVNVFNNARKYAGKFWVKAYLEGDKAIISILDDGPGINPDELGKVLSPYYRTKRVQKTNIEGSGLGMAITSTAVQFHNGKFKLRNREKGGLQVTITLPLKPKA